MQSDNYREVCCIDPTTRVALNRGPQCNPGATPVQHLPQNGYTVTALHPGKTYL